MGHNPPYDIFDRDGYLADIGGLQALYPLLRELSVLPYDDLVRFRISNVLAGSLSQKQIEVHFFKKPLLVDNDLLTAVKIIQQDLDIIVQGLEEDRGRQFAAPVNPYMEQVLGVELEIEP